MEYEDRFGPLPEGLIKRSSMLTVNTSGRLFADIEYALRVGQPIENWDPYIRPISAGSCSDDDRSD